MVASLAKAQRAVAAAAVAAPVAMEGRTELVTTEVRAAMVTWAAVKRVVQDLVAAEAEAEAGTAMVGKLERAVVMGEGVMEEVATGTVEVKVAWEEAVALLVASSTQPLGPA
jgi:hypothetical protein